MLTHDSLTILGQAAYLLRPNPRRAVILSSQPVPSLFPLQPQKYPAPIAIY